MIVGTKVVAVQGVVGSTVDVELDGLPDRVVTGDGHLGFFAVAAVGGLHRVGVQVKRQIGHGARAGLRERKERGQDGYGKS